MALIGTAGSGDILIRDTGHAINKDPRTLFTDDNLKQKWKENKEIPNIHILSYYGDITGRGELKLRNKCNNIIRAYIQRLKSNSASGSSITSPSRSISDIKTTCHTMFKQSIIEIVYISHYAAEFVVNITNTKYIEDYKTDNSDKKVNTYLVGAYQIMEYQDVADEFITIGLTENISYLNNPLLYKFYIDDFIQDLFKILSYTSWYDDTCKLWDNMYYIIAGYTVDCILPVKYKRGANDEILLNDGALHLMMSGDLQPFQVNTEIFKIITEIFTDLGRLVKKEHRESKNLRSEYNKWKKQSFKKRINLRPSSTHQLNKMLIKHINKRNQVKHNRNLIKNLNCLYYNNNHFKLSLKNKKNKNKNKIRSFRKIFHKLGSSKNKKHKKTQTYHVINDLNHLIDLNGLNDINDINDINGAGASHMMSRSRTEPFVNPKPVKFKRNKSPTPSTNDIINHNYGNLSALSITASITKEYGNIGVDIKNTVSLPGASSVSKSHQYPIRNKRLSRRKSHNRAVSMDYGLSNTYMYGDEFNIMKRKSKKKLNMNIGGLIYIEYDQPLSHDLNTIKEKAIDTTHRHKRTQSATEMRLYTKVRNAYNEYVEKKNKIPSEVEYFINFCRKRNINGANWSVCETIMNDMKK